MASFLLARGIRGLAPQPFGRYQCLFRHNCSASISKSLLSSVITKSQRALSIPHTTSSKRAAQNGAFSTSKFPMRHGLLISERHFMRSYVSVSKTSWSMPIQRGNSGAVGDYGNSTARKPRLDARSRSPLQSLADSMARGIEAQDVSLPPGAWTINGKATCSNEDAGTTWEAAKGGDAAKKDEAKPWFKETSDKVVGYWLLGSAGLVFGIVVLGGLTRLTESGLSITEWKPVTGALPPMSAADWKKNFAKYKDSPEYRILNPNMTLEEFKFIYFMEWAHRLWGRLIGLTFVIPAAYFIARGRVSSRMALKLGGIAGLIGFQGFIGWWMVKSGLKDDIFNTNNVPRVSQYRLTAHLGAAFTVYLAMLYNGLAILRDHRLLKEPILALAELKTRSDPRLLFLGRSVAGLAVLAFITAMSGGLVAGLDAGLIYNEFPYMGENFKPPNSELFNPFYARDKEGYRDLWWRNLFENPSTVQFQHRCLAMTTFTAVLAFWAYARFAMGGKLWKTVMTKLMRAGTTGILHLVLMQVALGISALIYMVPTPIAAAHQAGALAVLSGTIVLGSRLWLPRQIVPLVNRKANAQMMLGSHKDPTFAVPSATANSTATTSGPSVPMPPIRYVMRGSKPIETKPAITDTTSQGATMPVRWVLPPNDKAKSVHSSEKTPGALSEKPEIKEEMMRYVPFKRTNPPESIDKAGSTDTVERKPGK